MCVATTTYQRTTLLHALGVEPARVRIIPNGVDLSAMAGSGTVLKPSWHDAGRIHIAVLGFPNERKNQALLIRAIAVLRETHPNAVGVISSPYSPEDEHYLVFSGDLARQMNLQTRFCLSPLRKIKKTLFAGVDILASTAVREGFGRTIVEAMAAGCPVVARRAGGPETIIEHKRTGLLVSGDDPAESGECAAQNY